MNDNLCRCNRQIIRALKAALREVGNIADVPDDEAASALFAAERELVHTLRLMKQQEDQVQRRA